MLPLLLTNNYRQKSVSYTYHSKYSQCKHGHVIKHAVDINTHSEFIYIPIFHKLTIIINMISVYQKMVLNLHLFVHNVI